MCFFSVQDSNQRARRKVFFSVQDSTEQSAPTAEDYESSDDESDVSDHDKSVEDKKGVDIPTENHILCDPPTPSVHSNVKEEMNPITETVSVVKSDNMLYTLVGDSKIYSNKDFPIKNVNQSLIDKCDPIPKAEIRKQFGNKRFLAKQQPITFKGKQKEQRASNPKVSQPRVDPKGACFKKKDKDVKFVASKGTDKVETFENKSNIDLVQKIRILKRNNQNNYTQHTNGCDERTSTSDSTSSTSSRQDGSPKFVESRSCFKCGEFGDIIKNCTNSPKAKFVERTPSENDHPKRCSASTKQDKRTIKEQETKQRHKNIKVIESALKLDVKSVKRKPS
ncbi:putative transcription factor interactor and regulator CCHC(Zn) family [Helianthus anomalus]